MGLAFAELMVANGASVTIVARNAAKLQSAHRTLEGKRGSRGGTVQSFSCDVSNAAQLEDVVVQAERGAGMPVDVLVANAGLSVPRLFHEQKEEEVRQMMEVNYLGCVNAARAVIAGMRKRRQGRLVFVGSAMSVTAFAGYAAYCGSKWALRGFAEALATETERYGVSVHVFYAPTMNTPGLATENIAKPEVTRKLEDIGTALSAAEAAQTLSYGLGRDAFAVAGDPGIELLALASLPSPYGNLALRVLVAPLVTLMAAGWRWFIGFMVKKHMK